MTYASTLAKPVAAPKPAQRTARASWVAVGLFLGARLSGAAVLALVAHRAGRHPLTLLARSWDSVWYLGIAAHGYGHNLPSHLPGPHSDLAFFPLYPLLERTASALTPVGADMAGLLLSWAAAAVAAAGIHAVGSRLHGRATGLALVLLWALLPHSVVLSMAYTEPLLTAFAAWSLYAVLAGNWLWAGVLAALAGLARPNGCAVAAAVLAGAAAEVWRRRGKVSHRLWTGAALAPLGWTAYVLWVGGRKGDLLGGYFEVQRLWGSRFDFGRGSVQYLSAMLLHGSRFEVPMALAVVAAGALLYAVLFLDRAPLALLVYSGVLLLIALGGSGFFESKPRFLLPAFPLLLPLAHGLVRTARARPWHATVLVACLAGLSYLYGAYLVVYALAPL
ncbi:mannosyltransferase family protein [Streptomyces alanosinicus]|uniref:Membrane protein n=1 Tax=Streptomyces alanosinicus TaxID=68171 RepID=A0A918YPI9_9ACTN|nr:mannosyltransferase family protein [Streptomyces alanosinicus]GHE10579.1 membrane protein [Streptomyces alanosinicus]